jgi:hypothetical protein
MTSSTRARQTRPLFWVECILGATSAALAILTLIVPRWIEITLRVDPDGGNGTLEWLIALAFICSAATLLTAARRGAITHLPA